MTLALAMSAPEANFLSSLRTASTSSKVTLPPTLPSSRSMRMVLPGSTRYCFPPVRITAYMLPPEASDNPRLYVAAGGSVNEVSAASWRHRSVKFCLGASQETIPSADGVSLGAANSNGKWWSSGVAARRDKTRCGLAVERMWHALSSSPLALCGGQSLPRPQCDAWSADNFRRPHHR